MSVSMVMDLAQAREWQELLDAMPVPLRDIYFAPAYHRMHQVNGDGKANLFLYQDGADTWLYPFFARPITHVGQTPVPFFCQDLETVYGYSGPLSTTAAPGFLKAACDGFRQYCRENHVVTEFIRFHPIIGNHSALDTLDDSSIIGIRDYVYIDLTLSDSELWEHSYSSTNRNMIRKARKLGVRVEHGSTASGFERFVQLYLTNMQRVDAEPYYFFSEAYFAHLKHLVDRSGILLLACLDDQVVGASIFLQGGRYAHYHLSASDDRGRKAAATNLLVHHAIRWAREVGAEKMHLGGGMNSGQDDSLFRFKANFSPLRVRFHIGKRVHQEETYHWLTNEWERQYPERAPEYRHILQRYRLELGQHETNLAR